MGKTAIVIGATGVVGREIINQLAALDIFENVVSLTRREVKYNKPKVSNYVVNFEQLEQAEKHFKGDYLFSALGTTLKQAGSIDAQRKIDVEYQFKAAQLAARNGVSQYLLVSSSGSSVDSKSSYLRMKGELENKIRTLSFKRTIFVRPSLLLGNRSDFRVAEKLGAFILPLICRIPMFAKYKPITGAEVASAMIRISQRPGEGVEIHTLDELFDKPSE